MREITFMLLFLTFFLSLKAQHYQCFTEDIDTSNVIVNMTETCMDFTKYIPNDLSSRLYVKINYHFFRMNDGTGIYQPSDSSLIKRMTNWVNDMYRHLQPPTIPAIPPADTLYDSKISFTVKGVYYHDNSDYYIRYKSHCLGIFYNTYGVNKTSEINVFFYIDTAFSYGGGCAKTNYITMHNNNISSYAAAQLLAHELGHSLGLWHTWERQFDDTFYPDDNTAALPCNNSTISNNIMGYNTCGSYLSPKQIGYMHFRLLSNENGFKYVDCINNAVNDSIIISSNKTINHSTFFDKNVIIRPNATLTIKCKVYLSTSVTITIKPGGRLIIDGGTLTNVCNDEMWGGIFVSGNTHLPQTPQNQGVLELKNGAIIENAWNAISTSELTANGGTDWNTRGGIIYANDALFKNNKRSVEFLAYINGGSGRVTQNVSYFNNCTFTIDDNNLFESNNTNFLYHISMWGVTGVQIKGCVFENNIENMPDRRQAIYTIDAGYVVDDYCSSYNMQTCECNNIPTPSDFRGFNRAIESSNSTTQYAIRIDRSNFASNITGIDIRGKNSFQLSRLNVDINVGYDNYPVGIYIDQCTGYKIEGNEIYRGGIFHVSNTPTGIRVNRAGSNENRIYRNEISGTHYGIRVTEAISNPPVRAFPLTGLQFICNDLYGNYHDISIHNSGIVRASQGSATSGANNLFSQNGNYDIYNGSPNIMDYYCRRGARTTPTYITNNVNVRSATGNPCELTFPCNYLIDTPSQKSSELPLAAYRELNKKYTEMLSHFYAKGYDKILNDYYNGIIENEEFLKEAMTYHEEILAITEYMAEFSDEALFALKTDNIIDFTQIRDWYDEIYTLSAKYSLAETYYQLEKFEEGLKILDLIPRMFNLNKNEMIEHDNYVSLFKFKNEIRESGRTIAELKKEEIEKMTHFAKASQGLSALMAQSVLCFFYEICFEEAEGGKQNVESGDDEIINLCKSATSVSSVCEKNVLENITIHPNPTTGELQVTSYGLQVTSIEILDITGRILSSNHIAPLTSHSSSLINISHLKSGIYFVKIATNAGDVIKKVIKQ